MKSGVTVILAVALAAAQLHSGDYTWYSGDEHCQPPKDDGRYSAPYNPLDHRQDYPIFSGADKPGWSCSYQRKDGVVVQYGDSRTPQQQWLAVWGDNTNN